MGFPESPQDENNPQHQPWKPDFSANQLVASLLENRVSLREWEYEKKLLEEMADCYARYDVEGLALVVQKIDDYADEVALWWDYHGASEVLNFFDESMVIFRTSGEILDK